MPERSPMTTVGDTVTIDIPRKLNGTVTFIVSGGASPVGITCIPEISADDGTTWETATVNRPDRSTAVSLSSGQSGWTEAPGYTKARLRLSAVTSGTTGGRVNFGEG